MATCPLCGQNQTKKEALYHLLPPKFSFASTGASLRPGAVPVPIAELELLEVRWQVVLAASVRSTQLSLSGHCTCRLGTCQLNE